MKLTKVVLSMAAAGGLFVAGVAVGKATKSPSYLAREEVKMLDTQPGGPKLGALTGDPKKGPYMGLLQIPAGMVEPMHSHTGDYEGVMIEGTSSHWLKGEDSTKAKKLPPGSYYTMPGKVEHQSACDQGKDCLILIIQKTKFDVIPSKDDKLNAAGAPPKPDQVKPPTPDSKKPSVTRPTP
ncbi:MAG TPA: cupin domain-containing protein [Kofleriaceae bacterium]|nr:cupin domain-containing protein [Kofleriaceae bacterium]